MNREVGTQGSVVPPDGGGSSGWLKPLLEALDHTVVERIHRDPFQRDPKTVQEFCP